VEWISLLSRIEDLELSQEHDTFYWNLTPNGKFLVKSYYTTLKFSTTPNVNRDTWKMKVSLKIIFMVYTKESNFHKRIIWPNETSMKV
jgi:hypothetical protein